MPNTGPSDNSPVLPAELQDKINRLVQPMELSVSRYDKFVEELTSTTANEDGTSSPTYTVSMINRTLDIWFKFNYGNRNKGERYFLAILKRIKNDAAVEQKHLDRTPPMFGG